MEDGYVGAKSTAELAEIAEKTESKTCGILTPLCAISVQPSLASE